MNKFYPSLENHFIQFKDLDNSYGELVAKFVILEKAIDYATLLDSTNIKYCETGYALCSRVIQIPKQYALADEGAAWAQGLIGAVQDNKYKTQDAIQARQKAVARKQEINRAALIVYELEMKYSKKIDPNYEPSENSLTPDSSNDPTTYFIITTFKELSKKCSRESSRVETHIKIKKDFGLKDPKARELVDKVLIENKLMDANEIKKQDRQAILVVTIFFVICFIIWFLTANKG